MRERTAWMTLSMRLGGRDMRVTVRGLWAVQLLVTVLDCSCVSPVPGGPMTGTAGHCPAFLEQGVERSASGWINGFIGVVIFAGSLPATRLAVMELDASFVTAARA